MNNELPHKILEDLQKIYDDDPTGVAGIDYFTSILNLSATEIQGGLIYLKEKEWIKSFLDQNNEWVQKISAKGIDELENFKNTKQDYNKEFKTNNEKPLELDIIHEDHAGKIKVFISHKFVESDQRLATILHSSLSEHNIYGYLAERKREYDLVFGEKIKNEIKSSDYLIAIITKNSHLAPSVHQEIGYAIGVNVPVRIMAEEQEIKGVLVEGKDIEKFSRQNFEQSLDNIIKDIKKNGIRKKLTSKEKEDLITHVYRPSFNQLMNIYSRRDFIIEIPDNPWNKLEPFWQLKCEAEISKLFKEFENERNTWQFSIFYERKIRFVFFV